MEKILIIEDNHEVRQLQCLWFEQWSIASVTAGTLTEAREVILTCGPFKVIVCKFELPDGNGLQLFVWLRHEQHDPAAFLLISEGASLLRFYRAQDFMVLTRPFQPDELCSRVRGLINGMPVAAPLANARVLRAAHGRL